MVKNSGNSEIKHKLWKKNCGKKYCKKMEIVEKSRYSEKKRYTGKNR